MGIREGSPENATVVGELMGELAERGVQFEEPRLYVVDGSKAIRRAILNYAGGRLLSTEIRTSSRRFAGRYDATRSDEDCGAWHIREMEASRCETGGRCRLAHLEARL